MDGEIDMTKFKAVGAIALALSLAAASPSFAAGMRGGHMGGGHFHGGGFRGGVGPGIAAGLIAGSVIGGAAYGYYGAPDYDYGDSYGYYNNGYDSYDRSMSPEGNSN
jgi:hypothetical protein